MHASRAFRWELQEVGWGGGEVAVKGEGCLLSDTYTHVQMN